MPQKYMEHILFLLHVNTQEIELKSSLLWVIAFHHGKDVYAASKGICELGTDDFDVCQVP